MAREQYENWNPKPESLRLIDIAEGICADMKAQGYDLTLRQLYYQFVARDHIPNNQRSYNNLGSLINKARLAGLLDWKYIEDRGRSMKGRNHYDNPGQLVSYNRYYFGMDRWEGQQYRVEVWVEKEALVSVVGQPAARLDVNYFACKGYVSQSELHGASKRHKRYEADGAQVIVLHLGDHDPSGIDMTRDIQDRLRMFGAHTMVKRIALNMDQIDLYEPPPNPAKLTDSRAVGYIDIHGDFSWELDALEPAMLDELVTAEIEMYLDRDRYDRLLATEDHGKELLARVGENWAAVEQFINDLEDE